MEMAIGWPGEHLSARGDTDLARLVQRVAFFRSLDLDMEYVARRIGGSLRKLRQDNQRGLDLIAAELRKKRVPIF